MAWNKLHHLQNW